MKKGWGESRWKRVARFRLGSEVKESRYWEGEELKKCRMCGGGEKNHVNMCGRNVESGKREGGTGRMRWTEYWGRRGRERDG